MHEPTYTDQISAWSALAAAVFSLLVLVIAVATWRVARQALNASRDANLQAKRDSIEQTRPYVFAEVCPSLMGAPHWDIRIVNVGRSSALELTLDFSNWPGEPDNVAESVRALFQTPRTLPPGASVRAMWRLDAGNGEFAGGTKTAGLPETGAITVTYRSNDPAVRKVYTDTFDVMIQNSGFWPVPDGGPGAPSQLDAAQEAFYKLGQSIARNIGELGR